MMLSGILSSIKALVIETHTGNYCPDEKSVHFLGNMFVNYMYAMSSYAYFLLLIFQIDTLIKLYQWWICKYLLFYIIFVRHIPLWNPWRHGHVIWWAVSNSSQSGRPLLTPPWFSGCLGLHSQQDSWQQFCRLLPDRTPYVVQVSIILVVIQFHGSHCSSETGKFGRMLQIVSNVREIGLAFGKKRCWQIFMSFHFII